MWSHYKHIGSEKALQGPTPSILASRPEAFCLGSVNRAGHCYNLSAKVTVTVCCALIQAVLVITPVCTLQTKCLPEVQLAWGNPFAAVPLKATVSPWLVSVFESVQVCVSITVRLISRDMTY